MAALPPPPGGAPGAPPPLQPPPLPPGLVIPTRQAARRSIQNALRPNILRTPFRDNGVTAALQNAINIYTTFFEPSDALTPEGRKYLYELQVDIFIWGLRYWAITVPQVGGEAETQLVQSYGFNYRMSAMPSTHTTARVARLIADRLLLLDAFRRAKDLGITHVVDYYGSKRNRDLNGFATSMLAPFFTRRIHLDWYRPLLTGKDRSDYTHLLVNDPSVGSNPAYPFIAILSDIYCPPRDIVEELDRTQCVQAMFAVQLFFKDVVAGFHFDHMTYINDNGLVRQAPGVLDHEWPATHTNEEWQTHRSFHTHNQGPRTWEWDSFQTVSDYRLYRLVVTQGHLPQEQPMSPARPKSALLYTRTITPKTIQSRCKAALSTFLGYHSIFNRPLLVFMPAVNELSVKYVNKTRQTYQESNCQTEIGNIINSDDYALFWENLKDSAGITKAQVALDTHTYIFWGTLEDDYNVRQGLASSLGDTWRAFKEVKNSMFIKDQINLWPFALTLFALAVGFYYRKYLPRITIRQGSAFGATIPEFLWNKITSTANYFRTAAPVIPVPEIPPQVREYLPSVPTTEEISRAIPDSTTLPTLKESAILTIGQIQSADPQISTQTAIYVATGVATMFAPIYEEAFKKYFKYGTLIMALAEGVGNPIVTALKYWFHYTVTNRENRVTAHHSWNTGCSLSMIVLGNSSALTWVAKYMWPLHLAAIISQYRFENFRWLVAGFITNHLAMAIAVRFLAQAPPGFAPVLVLIAFAIFAFFTRDTPKPTNEENVAQFTRDYKKVQSHLLVYPETMSLNFKTARLPAITHTKIYPEAPVDPDVMNDIEARPEVYVLLGTTAMMYRPYGFNQFYHAYQQRNVLPCLLTPHCEIDGDFCKLNTLRRTDCPIGLEWKKAAKWTCAVIKLTIGNLDMQVVPLKSQEWIQHFNGAAKKQRARDGIEQRNQGALRKETSIFLKGDEVLYGRDGVLKPRTVKALHPTVQSTCYKEVAEAMDRFKIFFNEEVVHTVRSWSVTFSVGSGKTSSQLDKWLKKSYNWISISKKRAAVIVAGDDFFAIIHDKNGIRFFENDFSKYDRTQGVHAQDAERQILLLLGMSEYVAFTLFSTANLQPRYESKRLDFHQIMKMPPQRATGAPDTTIGNTINNIASVIYSLMISNDFDHLAKDQAELGLEAKLQIHDELSHATFLKGWWMPAGHKYHWLPLPSQTIKMGKILTLPTLIFKHLPEDSAWRSAAKSMGCSYQNVPHNYPLFGSLLKRYAQLEGETKNLLEYQPNDGHKIVVDKHVEIDEYIARMYVAQRYNLTYCEIVEMQEEISRMPFPGLAVHPGWARVSTRDYG